MTERKIFRTATIYDDLCGDVTVLAGVQGFQHRPFYGRIHYHKVQYDCGDPAIGEIIRSVVNPATVALFVDAGGRDDVHVVQERDLRIAKERNLAGLVINGALRGDTHQPAGRLWLAAIGRCIFPWKPASSLLALYYPSAEMSGALVIGDADGVIIISAEQGRRIGLGPMKRPLDSPDMSDPCGDDS